MEVQVTVIQKQIILILQLKVILGVELRKILWLVLIKLKRKKYNFYHLNHNSSNLITQRFQMTLNSLMVISQTLA